MTVPIHCTARPDTSNVPTAAHGPVPTVPRTSRQPVAQPQRHRSPAPAHRLVLDAGDPPLVLVVEDNPSEAALTVAGLRRSGFAHQSLVASSVTEARAALVSNDVSCVLLDLGLPDADGLSGLGAILDDADLPVVVLTGRDDADLAIESLGRGAQDYLVKGRTDGELIARTVRYAIERHRVERHARAGYELAQAVLDATDAHTAVLDSTGTIVSTNAAWVRFGHDNGAQESRCGIGTSYLAVSRSAGAHDVADGIEQVLIGARSSYRQEYACHSPDVRRWFELRVAPMLLPTGHGAVITHSPITDLKEVQERLADLAARDPLTGLANRHVAIAAIGAAVEDVRTEGLLSAVVFLDLDRFKVVNDSLGHAVGDVLLRETANRLSRAVRGSDVVARFGGDEFVVVCRDVANEDDAIQMAERLRRECSRPYQCDGRTATVGASLGLTFVRDGTEDPEALLDDADTAMYHAKATGRGRVHLFEPQLRTDARRRFDRSAELRDAIAQGDLCVHYQPVVHTDTEAVAGAEALVRWNRNGALVGPNQFIHLAEETDLIVDLDRFVLRQACRDAKQWIEELGFAGTVSVNLSAVHLLDDWLADLVGDALHESGLPAQRLVLEVTETALIAEPVQAAAVLGAIRSLGVLVAVDDFGTGYSSLAHLKRLPVDELKIDRSFVDGLGTDPLDDTIVRSVIELGAALDVRVVAEGVENDHQLRALRDMHCPYAQGFHWSPAIQAQRFLSYLGHRARPSA